MRKTIPPKKPSGTAEPEPQPAPRFTPRGGGGKSRLLIAVADNPERIDFQNMSPESGKRLNELMHMPEVQKQLGIGVLTDKFDPRHCKRVWEGVGHILAGIGGFVFKWPASACAEFHFTESEKDELAEPTAAALDEIAPKWLKENQAVAALLVVAGAIIQNKMRAAATEARRVMLERQQMVNAAAGVPPGVEPVVLHRQPTGPSVEQPKAPGRVVIPTAASGFGPTNGGAQPPNLGGASGKVGA